MPFFFFFIISSWTLFKEQEMKRGSSECHSFSSIQRRTAALPLYSLLHFNSLSLSHFFAEQVKLSVIAAESGSGAGGAGSNSSGAVKSGRGSVDGTNQGESSRLLQPAIKDRTKADNVQRPSEMIADVHRRNSKDQSRPEKKTRMSEDVEVIADVDEREYEEETEVEMESKREKSHTTKRVEVLEDEAYIWIASRSYSNSYCIWQVDP